MPNESITDDLVRDRLIEFGYEQVERQKTSDRKLDSLIKSKREGSTAAGSVDIYARVPGRPDIVVLVESKADNRLHGKPGDDAAKYAVPGALKYAADAAAEYTVLAIAASGTTPDTLKLSFFAHDRGDAAPRALTDTAGRQLREIPKATDVPRLLDKTPSVTADQEKLNKTAVGLHEYMRNYGALSETTKPLIVAGSLIALRDPFFFKTFPDMDNKDEGRPTPQFGDQWVAAIRDSFTDSDVPKSKIDQVVSVFRSALEQSPALLQRNVKSTVRGKKKEEAGSVLAAIVRELAEHVFPEMHAGNSFDLIGAFYGEFLRYTAGDKKGLGIVLTPPHITDLFARIANPLPTDTVLDPCTGTGGFLIAAMQHMTNPENHAQAITEDDVERVKSEGLMGVEFIPNMYALAASNMLLRGDGKSNLFLGSCFDESIRTALVSGEREAGPKMPRPTVGLINPPYSQGKKDADLVEMSFILNMLNTLAPGGRGVAIVPMSCATGQDTYRERLLEKHTLEAVMTMPPDLFYGVGTQTVIMVFTAHQPHPGWKRTWFARWNDDGHVTLRGRKDLKGRWPAIRDMWLADFRNRRQDTPGYCVSRHVGATDEWLAEAYMETDYSSITDETFIDVLREFAVYKMMNEVEA